MQKQVVMVQHQQLDVFYGKTNMNAHDRENIAFLLSADEATLRDWYNKMGNDDIEYATEIMAAYSEELRVKSALLKKDVPNVNSANRLLKKFRL